jgi:elongation factor G
METIGKGAEAMYRHKKQSGGRGQFGEVHLRVAPIPSGFEFVDQVKGGVIPSPFMPAVEKGINEALTEGVLAGYPLDGIQVTVFFGKHHPVDSSEIAFKIAAAQAFKAAMKDANPSLLEPIVKVTVLTPREYTGDIMSSLSGKRGNILGMGSTEEGVEKIEASVPQAEAMEYAIELKSLTQGRATFQQEFMEYQVVGSPKMAEELLRREGKEVAAAA